MKDKQGREYAHLDRIKPGDLLQCDDGFQCMKGTVEVHLFDNQGLYVPCSHGMHFLEGQVEGEGWLIGLYPIIQ